MKIFSPLLPGAMVSLALFFGAAGFQRAFSQVPASPEIARPSGAPGAASSEPNALDAPLVAQPLTARELRERAYAKLLEGQRYLSEIRGQVEASSERLAQLTRRAHDAFQQAAVLDTGLAEAHTGLAEISFFYPPQDFDYSAREARTAAAVDKDNFGAHRLLSRIYSIESGLRDHNLDRALAELAIGELREVARLYPADAESWALLGEFYQATGRPREAIDAWNHWLAAPPAADPRIFQLITNGRDLAPDAAAARLGEALVGAGRTAEGIAMLRRAIAMNPENRSYALLLGQAAEVAGVAAVSAIDELKRLVHAHPEDTTTLQLLARVQARTGHADEALSLLRGGISRLEKGDRNQLSLRLSLAQTFVDALRYTEAVATYDDLLRDAGIGTGPVKTRDQRSVASDILGRMAGLQIRAGDTKSARSTIDRMRRILGKDDTAADVQDVLLLRSEGQLREALAAARAARQRSPLGQDLIRLEAETLCDAGQVDQGIALLRAQLHRSAEDLETLLTIAALLTGAGRGPEAVVAANEALALVPSERGDLLTGALVCLSSAQERAGDYHGGEKSLRRVLAVDPNNAAALNNLGYFLAERGDRLPEALEMVQRAVRAEPTNSSYLDSLGWTYFKLGNLDLAERHLTEAARRDATSATIQEHLGDLYARLGKTDAARAAWRRALALPAPAGSAGRIRAKLGAQSR